jgi:hypothetical protein
MFDDLTPLFERPVGASAPGRAWFSHVTFVCWNTRWFCISVLFFSLRLRQRLVFILHTIFRIGNSNHINFVATGRASHRDTSYS